MTYATKEDAIRNWPTWSDGTPVKVGERAVSLRGPRTIEGVELDGRGYTLWGRIDDVEGASLRYIIDQGDHDSHPCREGEPCDFWDEEDGSDDLESDVGHVMIHVRRIARVYGLGVDEVIGMLG